MCGQSIMKKEIQKVGSTLSIVQMKDGDILGLSQFELEHAKCYTRNMTTTKSNVP
jgi:hypothetical protein